jgi:site-specific DNA-methyltransferase (adenine-specific)
MYSIYIMELYNADCLVKLKDLSANSVDCVILDLPYGTTECAWDTKIDLAKLWEQLLRVGKEKTAYFFFCDFRLGVEIVNSNPKMFRYDMVWNKKSASNPLLAKKRIRAAHENILVFYKKCPVFHWEKYHTIQDIDRKKLNLNNDGCFPRNKGGVIPNTYEPTLPVSVMEHEDEPKEEEWVGCFPKENMLGHCGKTYEPRLPLSVIEEDGGKCYPSACGNPSGLYEPKLPTSVMEYQRIIGKKRKHPTEKPIALLEHLIKYYTADDAVVLDPTMGSGTTGKACKNLGRRFIGIELNKVIYDIAVERLATEEEKSDTI